MKTLQFQEANNSSSKGASPTKEPSPPVRNSAEFHEIEGSLKTVKSVDRYSSQSSNSLQSINSILSDEANTSMLTYSSVAAAPKNAKNDTIHAVEDNVNNVVPKVRIEHVEEIQSIEKEGGIESASQSLTDILDSVRPPKMRPPSAHRELLGTRYQGSQESLAESIDRSMATTPDLTGSMTKLPGGRGLQKHIDMSRIDLERQQKVIYISDHVYFLTYFRTF